MDSSTASPPRDQSQPKQPRRFNRSQRAALYLAAQGVCSECGKALPADWHADHIIPYSKDGSTDVANGQALCPECNLRKGSRMAQLAPWPRTMTMRDWQESALLRYRECGATDFLVEATPGAGKTKFALRAAHDELSLAAVERLVIVVPSEHLREQWSMAAGGVGIQLDPDWTSDKGQENADFHGIIVTYQAVASNPDMQRLLCARRRTMVIFDEIHHAGDSLSWGDNIRYAFENAPRRLALSGTPFRTDRKPIPFVRYDADGQSISDLSYSYGDALRDEVCRHVVFDHWEGRMEWLSGSNIITAMFRDELPEEEASRRLRTALDVSGDWLREVLGRADRQLTEIRDNGHPGAGALVVCIDQAHARGIAKILRDITGDDPTVVVSEDPHASSRITTFGDGSSRWIVAVKMVSEGVDIPRLRVGVYATNIITELYFRQFIGRFVRKTEGVDEQFASIFLPAEENLMVYAGRVKEEVDQAIAELEERIQREASERSMSADNLFQPQRSEAEKDRTIYNGVVIEASEWQRAQRIGDKVGFTTSEHIFKMAMALREAGIDTQSQDTKPNQPVSRPAAVFEERRALRETSAVKVRQFASMISSLAPWDRKDIFMTINLKLNQAVGIASVRDASIDELLARGRQCQEWMDELKRSSEVGNESEWFAGWIGTNVRSAHA